MDKINDNDTENKTYILKQIDAAFKSKDFNVGGGGKRKNKTKGNRSPFKKKRRTKRK